MLLEQEKILNKVRADLNALAIELGFVDDEGRPLYHFYGELSTYDNYDWIKSIETYNADDTLKYLPIIPFALIRDNSVPSSGETINERLDEYSFYTYIKTHQIDDIREIFETYMARENMDNNLVEIEGSNVLKRFSNFIIDDEELAGAPDGDSRHQVVMSFSYDIFELSLTSSKDYELLIDDVRVKYLSWRFEKANMVIANNSNTNAGTILQNVNKLHEVVLVCELYLDKSNTSVLKVRDDLFSLHKTNTSYKLELKLDGESIFTDNVILNGGKTTDVPPQINTMEVTFALSYERAAISIGLLGVTDENGEQVLERIPVLKYKFGHAAALYTATYFGDNSSRSRVVGLAKGILLTVPVLVNEPEDSIMNIIIQEVLGKVYTNHYVVQFTYLGITREYQLVLNESAIESDDAAYDIVSLIFVEAK